MVMRHLIAVRALSIATREELARHAPSPTSIDICHRTINKRGKLATNNPQRCGRPAFATFYHWDEPLCRRHLLAERRYLAGAVEWIDRILAGEFR